MTLRIERTSEGESTTIRLIGRIRAEHLDQLNAQIKDEAWAVDTLDLEEVILVDVEAVRFLGRCQAFGIRLVHCSPFIEKWIEKELSGED